METELELGLEPKVVGHVVFSYPITNEMINDILVTGIETGIGYWCQSMGSVGADLAVGPGLHLGEGGSLEFETEEGYSTMTLASFLFAYKRHCDEKGWNPAEMHEQGDCEDADVIIQYAIFGELVYA